MSYTAGSVAVTMECRWKPFGSLQVVSCLDVILTDCKAGLHQTSKHTFLSIRKSGVVVAAAVVVVVVGVGIAVAVIEGLFLR